MQVYRFDSDGIFKEPVILQDNEQLPADCTEVKPIDGLYKAKYVDGQWIESLSDEKINTIKNTAKPLSEIEQVRKQQADLTFTLMMNGVI